MTREEFEYAIKSCGCFIYRGQTYYEESELIKAFEDMGLIEQEPRYCDRNICLRNEYNGIGCEECEVTKSQEPTDENLHREREQAYMQGYEDASKRFRQEPCEDAISRQAALELFTWTNTKEDIWYGLKQLPPVKPQEKTGHREYNDIYDHYLCGNCKTIVMDYDNFCPNCGAKMVDSDIDGIASDKLTTEDGEPDGVGQFFCP